METGTVRRKLVSRNWVFVCENTGHLARATIPEVPDPSHAGHVWACAPVLAQYAWHHRERTRGKHVLELGAGTSLPGLVCARLEDNHVTLSDLPQPQTLNMCYKSCRANLMEEEVDIIGLTWGQFDPALLKLRQVDFILGSDCFYDPKDFEDILVTVSFLMDRNPQCEFWMTYEVRSENRSIAHLLRKWNLECRRVSLKSFHADKSHLGGSDLSAKHMIEMWVITRREKVNNV